MKSNSMPQAKQSRMADGVSRYALLAAILCLIGRVVAPNVLAGPQLRVIDLSLAAAMVVFLFVLAYRQVTRLF